jgi:hypothetical protein
MGLLPKSNLGDVYIMQKTTDVTLFFPSGDGVKEGSHTATYKSVKNFTINPDNTVSFETVEHGKITTPALWRLKSPIAGQVEAPARANRAPRGY